MDTHEGTQVYLSVTMTSATVAAMAVNHANIHLISRLCSSINNVSLPLYRRHKRSPERPPASLTDISMRVRIITPL